MKYKLKRNKIKYHIYLIVFPPLEGNRNTEGIKKEERQGSEEEWYCMCVSPLYSQNAAHRGGGGGRGRLFNHPCGRAMGGGRRGGDGQAHCHALFCISLMTTRQNDPITEGQTNRIHLSFLCSACDSCPSYFLTWWRLTRLDETNLHYLKNRRGCQQCTSKFYLQIVSGDLLQNVQTCSILPRWKG